MHGRGLDVGCGVGDMLAFRPNTIGVDINPHTVEWCCSKGFDARLMEEDIFPFADSTFDSVVLDNVLEHISDATPILREIHRVLVSDGIFIAGVPGELGFSSDADHKVFYSKKKLIKTVTDEGFAALKVFGMPLNLPWLAPRIRLYCIYGVFEKVQIK
jgi:SAM-dependent methyltransferase